MMNAERVTKTIPEGRFERPVVLGAGQVGRALVDVLVHRGHRPVVVTRSGTELPGASSLTADMSNPTAALVALSDATMVFSTAQPEYHRWAEEFPALQRSIIDACVAVAVPLIVTENLYGYGQHSGPMAESTPMNPCSKKGRVRLDMWKELLAASDAGSLDMAVVRASDFVGVGVEGSAFGSRFFDPLRKGKPAQTVGDTDALHSVTFIPDLAEAMVRVAEDESTWGRAWHAPCAPAVSQNEMARIAAATVGHTGTAKAAPLWMLRLLGVFVPPVRETIEMLYEFDDEFVVDSSAFTAHFGMSATPLETSLAAVMGASFVGDRR